MNAQIVPVFTQEGIQKAAQSLNESSAFQDMCGRFDEVENWIDSNTIHFEFPLKHRFTPGMYIREIFMPQGSLLTSKIHLTEHPFVISYGVVTVWSPDEGTKVLQAPYTGTTMPGTRRILFCHTDVIWVTFHATQLTDVDEIEKLITMNRANPLLGK